MKKSGICPKCASTSIINDARVLGYVPRTGDLTVRTLRDPDALVFKEAQDSSVSAWVCGDCGFVELYADFPAHIRVP